MSKMTHDKKEAKIVIMGLDNSGKTSIRLSLERNTNLLSYYSLKPTPGLKIINFEDRNTLFNIWDFGGQEKYRKSYLEELDKFMEGVDKILFVIDVQDKERYDVALDYLQKIINALKKKNAKINLSVFLHKYDPDIERLENFSREQADRLIEMVKNTVPPEFNHKIFKTTIYTIFRKSLVT
ncbi:MAG: ADP-ribosylation factor-like protein [Candidatus Helarchaeota archaeon]